MMLPAEAVLTPGAARALIDSAKSDLGAAYTKLTAAYNGRAWESLGYRSWVDPCRAEFPNFAALALPPGERRDQVVAELKAKGMSTREIAAATSLSQPTVSRALRVGESDDSTADREGWRALVAEAEHKHGHPVRMPATIEDAVKTLQRLVRVEAAIRAAACALFVEYDYLDDDDASERMWDLLDFHRIVSRWPVAAEYLQLCQRHGIDVHGEYDDWAREQVHRVTDPNDYAALAAAGRWVRQAVAA